MLLLVLGCAAVAFGVLGCVRAPSNVSDGQNAPAPAPEPKPRPEPEPDPQAELDAKLKDWVAQSPMRQRMHAMWIDCGLIVRFAAGGRLVDYDWLEASAEDIARKADAFADMWEIIRDENRNMAVRAKAGEWFDAHLASQKLWSCCTDCHCEYWSPYMRGFNQETIQAWLDNGNAADDAPVGNIRLNAPPGFLRIMFSMFGSVNATNNAIEKQDAKAVLNATKNIHTIAADQVQIWRTIEGNARAIAERAEINHTDGIREHYEKIVQTCSNCHERFVNDGRTPLNPLPWKYHDE